MSATHRRAGGGALAGGGRPRELRGLVVTSTAQRRTTGQCGVGTLEAVCWKAMKNQEQLTIGHAASFVAATARTAVARFLVWSCGAAVVLACSCSSAAVTGGPVPAKAFSAPGQGRTSSFSNMRSLRRLAAAPRSAAACTAPATTRHRCAAASSRPLPARATAAPAQPPPLARQRPPRSPTMIGAETGAGDDRNRL